MAWELAAKGCYAELYIGAFVSMRPPRQLLFCHPQPLRY